MMDLAGRAAWTTTSEDPSRIVYLVCFMHSRVEWIRRLDEARQSPGLPSPELFTVPSGEAAEAEEMSEFEAQPSSEAGVEAAPAAEDALLPRLRREGDTGA